MFGLINTLMSKLDLVLEYISLYYTDIFPVDLSVSMQETNNLAL